VSAIGDRWAALQSREKTVIGILAGVVLLLIVYLLLFAGGGGNNNITTGPLPGVHVTPTANATQSPPPQTFEVFEGKDPFQPLVAPSSAPQPLPTGTPTSGGGSPPPSAQPTPGQRVTLMDVFTNNGTRYATVDVNGTEYTVKPGDTFAGSYRLLSLSGSCGNFVFGDEHFTLCVGQQVFK